MPAKTETAKTAKPKETPAGRWVSYRPELKVLDSFSGKKVVAVCGNMDSSTVRKEFPAHRVFDAGSFVDAVLAAPRTGSESP